MQKVRRKHKPVVLGESHLQQSFISWCNTQIILGIYPQLSCIMSIPNGAIQPRMRKRQLAEGMKVGAPDLFLAVPNGKFHGLFLELKSPTGKLSQEQKHMHHLLAAQGYAVVVGRNLAELITAVKDYLG